MIPDAPWRVVVLTQIHSVAKGYDALVRSLGHLPVAQVSVRPSEDRLAAEPQGREFVTMRLLDSPPEVDLVYPASKERLAEILRWYETDVLLCTGCPWRLPAEVLEVPRVAPVNGHPSLLPSYRGPIPVAWAIRNGETELGLTYHVMDEHFDTGPILAQGTVPLEDDDDWVSLTPRFEALAAELLPLAFARLARGERGDVQEGGSYRSLFGDDYLHVDPSRTALEVHTQVRAWRFGMGEGGKPGPLVEREGKRLRVVRTSLEEAPGAERLDCSDGPVWIVETAPVP